MNNLNIYAHEYNNPVLECKQESTHPLNVYYSDYNINQKQNTGLKRVYDELYRNIRKTVGDRL